MSLIKKFSNNHQTDSKISYGSGILTNIIAFAVDEINDVCLYHSKKPISFVFDKDGLIIDVDIKINYNCNVSEMAFNVQEAVRHNVESMTEYKITTVNVNVKDIFFDDSSDKK